MDRPCLRDVMVCALLFAVVDDKSYTSVIPLVFVSAPPGIYVQYIEYL